VDAPGFGGIAAGEDHGDRQAAVAAGGDDGQVAVGQVGAGEAEGGQGVILVGVGPGVVDHQVGADLVEGREEGLVDDFQVIGAGQEAALDREGEVLGLLAGGEEVDVVEVEDLRPRPLPEDGGGAIALVGVEVDDQDGADLALVMEDGGGQRGIGIDTKTPSPGGGRVVEAAAEVDRQAALQGQAARQDRPADGPPHRGQDAPVDQPRRQPRDDRHLQDGRQGRRPSERVEVLRRVDAQQFAPADRPGTDEVGRPPQAAPDQGVANPAILPAVERMEPLQAEGRDVVARVVDQGDHRRTPKPSVRGRSPFGRDGPGRSEL
jgi:hypothetical protein